MPHNQVADATLWYQGDAMQTRSSALSGQIWLRFPDIIPRNNISESRPFFRLLLFTFAMDYGAKANRRSRLLVKEAVTTVCLCMSDTVPGYFPSCFQLPTTPPRAFLVFILSCFPVQTQQTRGVVLMLCYRWASVCDAGPAIIQHWHDTSRFPLLNPGIIRLDSSFQTFCEAVTTNGRWEVNSGCCEVIIVIGDFNARRHVCLCVCCVVVAA